MESNTKLDSKKLTKILFITGFSLLLLFIVVRLIFKAKGEQVTDMPTIGELSYSPKKIQEQSKVQQFEEQRNEKQRKEMGLDENNYVVPNFHELTVKQNSDNENMQTNTDIHRLSNTEHINYTKNIEPSTQSKNTVPNSKLNYHSEYYSPKINEESTIVIQPQEIEITPVVQKNHFGTISTDNVMMNQKESSVTYSSGEIYGDQKIENNGVVIIRNTQPIAGSPAIPQNSILYGQATFYGNRVLIKINRAKTKLGEYSVSFSVNDNDRLEGIYFKAPIDETGDKTKDETEIPTVPGTYGKLITTVSNTTMKAGKELMKKNGTLNLEEGYKIFIIPIKQN